MSRGKKQTRREILAALGVAGAGTVALSACKPGWSDPKKDAYARAVDKPYVPGAEKYFTGEERWVNTSCAQCPAGCGVRVRVVEGRAVRIEGNPGNPLNEGGIGPRGLSSLQGLYDADRITGPMSRDGDRLVPVTWDAAIGQLATRLESLRSLGTPEKLLVVAGRERGFHRGLFERFAQAFGTPNFVDGRGSHTAPIRQAMKACLGVDEIPAYDWSGARHVLSLEAGLIEESCQSVYLTRVASAARTGSSRAKITHLGSTFNLSAYNADSWLRIEPGTSGAIALAIARILITTKRIAPGLAERSEGLDALARAVDTMTPKHAADISGALAEDIEVLADEMWANRPSFVVVDQRSTSFSNGYETATAALALNALLGSIEAPNAGLRLPATAPLAPWPQVVLDDIAKAGLAKPRLDRAGGPDFENAGSVLDALPKALTDNKSVDVALLYYSNPAYARPQPAAWKAALAKVPLVVSFSPFLDETVASVADLVLPDHTFLERWEDAAAAPGPPRAVVGVRRPAVEPLHDTRSSGDVLLALAQRVGGTVSTSLPWRTMRGLMDERLLGLRAAAGGSIVSKSDHGFLRSLYRAGVWHEAKERAPVKVTFRFRPGYALPEWKGDRSAYPLRLIAFRALGHAEGGGANMPWLRSIRSRPGTETQRLQVSIHPQDAAASGIANGAAIRIESIRGAIDAFALFDRRMSRGVLAVPLGGGRTAMGRWAGNHGGNVMELIDLDPTPRSGAGALCTTRVRVKARTV